MNAIITLLILCIIYRHIYLYYEHYLYENSHCYFGIFVFLYLLILYFINFEQNFTYRVLKNVYDTSRQPLYSFNSKLSNNELFQSSNLNIKEMIATKQNSRCYSCSNIIIQNDIPNYYLTYKVPLQNGGQNTPENLAIICPSCSQFK